MFHFYLKRSLIFDYIYCKLSCGLIFKTMNRTKKIRTLLLICSCLILLIMFFYQRKISATVADVKIEKRTIKKSKKEVPIETLIHPKKKLLFDFTYEHSLKDSSFFSADKFTGFSQNYSNDTLSVFCFRGNPNRTSPSRGYVSGRPIEIIDDWIYTTNYDTSKTKFGVWGGGSGWTGQPLIIHWNKEQKKKLHIADSTFCNDPNALEVIIGSLCGDIYFLNLATGTPTRTQLSIHNTIKGTVSVDPRKNGLLYVGQGIPNLGRMGAYVFDMFEEKEIYHIPGIDRFANRSWGAFDSNPLIDINSGTVFWPGENGLIYKFTIDSNKNISAPLKFKYNHNKIFRLGIESSMSVQNQFGFIADNSGTIMCIDLIKMAPVWNVDNFDDSDASIVFDTDSINHFSIYVGNEVDKRGPISESSFRKLNAVNGDEIWSISRKCYGSKINGKTNSGGILSTPVVGKHKGENIVYTIFSRVDSINKSELVAVDKKSGKELFSFFLDQYSWASPVDFYDKKGNIYLFFTDLIGNLYIIDGQTGELLAKKKTDLIIEASPVIINDRIVFASRGKSILSFKIK